MLKRLFRLNEIEHGKKLSLSFSNFDQRKITARSIWPAPQYKLQHEYEILKRIKS